MDISPSRISLYISLPAGSPDRFMLTVIAKLTKANSINNIRESISVRAFIIDQQNTAAMPMGAMLLPSY